MVADVGQVVDVIARTWRRPSACIVREIAPASPALASRCTWLVTARSHAAVRRAIVVVEKVRGAIHATMGDAQWNAGKFESRSTHGQCNGALDSFPGCFWLPGQGMPNSNGYVL